ncbi:MAG: hypothetical protein LBP19_08645 [Treponema sp.]|jgi:hypothetical protein|nr:hypothetical protein [Treponema sp.]
MKISIRNRKNEAVKPAKLNKPTPYDKRYGAWGRITDVDRDEKVAHSTDNSVDIFLDMGIFLKHVPVASNEWVVPGVESEKDYTTGERNLPPIGVRVFIMMPSGAFDDCFVLCSGFSTRDPAQNKPFMEEERETIRERITEGGWHTIYDCMTGFV